MYSCAFFGHAERDYSKEETFIRELIVYYIEEFSVTQFYTGSRGKFDHICARIVHSLKAEYPQIKLTKVFSYIPQGKEEYSSTYYDDSVYLLERRVPPKHAIIETNKALVEKVDFVISGVDHDWGGAAKAVDYAYQKEKPVFEIFKKRCLERKWETLMNGGNFPLTNSIKADLKKAVEEAIKMMNEKEEKSKKRKKK